MNDPLFAQSVEKRLPANMTGNGMRDCTQGRKNSLARVNLAPADRGVADANLRERMRWEDISAPKQGELV